MAMMGGGSWAIWNCVDDGTTTTIKKWLLEFVTLHNIESWFYMQLDKPYWVLGNNLSRR
jgi:hypothetical protein